jgi:hypothetical protein
VTVSRCLFTSLTALLYYVQVVESWCHWESGSPLRAFRPMRLICLQLQVCLAQLVLSGAHCEAECSFCSLMLKFFYTDVIVKVLVAALSQPMCVQNQTIRRFVANSSVRVSGSHAIICYSKSLVIMHIFLFYLAVTPHCHLPLGHQGCGCMLRSLLTSPPPPHVAADTMITSPAVMRPFVMRPVVKIFDRS